MILELVYYQRTLTVSSIRGLCNSDVISAVVRRGQDPSTATYQANLSPLSMILGFISAYYLLGEPLGEPLAKKFEVTLPYRGKTLD